MISPGRGQFRHDWGGVLFAFFDFISLSSNRIHGLGNVLHAKIREFLAPEIVSGNVIAVSESERSSPSPLSLFFLYNTPPGTAIPGGAI